MFIFGFLGAVAGVLLLLAGVFLIFFFPGVSEHQPEEFAHVGIVMGVIFFLFGVILIFL